MDEVLFSTLNNGLATVTLNRPNALNALNENMLVLIKEKLKEWETDDNIKVILFEGAGSRGFCAGGDIKTLYEAKDSEEGLEAAERFFKVEYETDELVATYSKPIIANLDGIVMGGGVGLTYGATYRLVTERTKWAMPEMNIGFFPDVGAAYFLNQAPGYTGYYVALTAKILSAADVLYMNAADYFVTSERLSELVEQLKETDWQQNDVKRKLAEVLAPFSEKPGVTGELATWQKKIDQHFSHDTVEEIVTSLEADSSDFAVETKKTLLSKSPVSLKVALKQMQVGKGKSFGECLTTDRVIASHFVRHDDFFEGVRSVLIDKDHNPQYRYQTLEEVSDRMVDSFFE